MISLMTIITGIKKYYMIAVLAILGLLYFQNTNLHKQLIKKENRIEQLDNNLNYYQDRLNGSIEKNRVLSLTVDELKDSKDSLLIEINKFRKQLKLKDKEIAQTQASVIHLVDTVMYTLPDSLKQSVDFPVQHISLNEFTTIDVSRQNAELNIKVDIWNTQVLFIRKRRVYKHKYSTGWARFWHFDWKKVPIHEYEIHNTNPLIKTTDVRIVNVKAGE